MVPESGTIVLEDNVTLFIETGATLKASGDRDDFRVLGALIVAVKARDVTVAGGGVIDGNFRPYFTERDSGGWKVTSRADVDDSHRRLREPRHREPDHSQRLGSAEL
jgi:polygalacturonase